MRNPVTLVIIVALAVVAAVILVRAVDRPDTDAGYMDRDMGAADAAPLAPADMTFVTRAAESGKAEVDLAQLAQRTSENPRIDALAEQLERDHEQANAQLEDLADRRDVDFPNNVIGLPGPNEQQQATYDRLDELENAAFDQAWLAQMAQNHEASVDLYTAASRSADPDVKAYAEKTLPVIKHHLEQIEAMQKTAATPQR
jgi:putative membrane protein